MAIYHRLSDDDGITLMPVEVPDDTNWQPIGPAFANEDLSTKAKLKSFCELWRTKLITMDVDKTTLLLLWLNLEWAIWESMRLIGGPNIPPEPARDPKAILQAIDRVIDWCEPEDKRKRTKGNWIGPAMAWFKADPTLKDSEIARKPDVNVHPSQLSRNKEWKAIRKAMAKANAANIPKGSKYRGEIEAIDDEE